jgi:BMFP domain-containing protein YqiC
MKQRTEAAMNTSNRIFDDLSKLMTNAMGVAQGARTEAETAMKGFIDRWMADRDFVTREEFDAVRGMAAKAREENEALKAAGCDGRVGQACRAQGEGVTGRESCIARSSYRYGQSGVRRLKLEMDSD